MENEKKTENRNEVDLDAEDSLNVEQPSYGKELGTTSGDVQDVSSGVEHKEPLQPAQSPEPILLVPMETETSTETPAATIETSASAESQVSTETQEALVSAESSVSMELSVSGEPPVSMETPVADVKNTTGDQASTSTPRIVDDETNSVYHLKWFEWKGQQTPIITQNENGPCPLLGIANVLILARKIELPPMQQIISATQLMEYIGDCILSSAPEQDRDNEELILNYQQNMQDAIDIMYKLQTGIDVNVKFSGVCDFEFTRECIVFDLLKIALYHGWLVDPQDSPAVTAIGNLSYNQVVEKLLTSKDSSDDNVVSEGLAIEDFLARTASQLTYHGLCELNDTVQEEELCVFFRNNHFSTVYKHKGELFLLVTDQGFLTEPAVIWETLVNIEGDGEFVNSNFRTIQLQSNPIPPATAPDDCSNTPAEPASVITPKANLSQEDQDYLLALSLQQEGSSPVVQPERPPPSSVSGQPPPVNLMDSDHALALQLQEDEDRRVSLEHQQQQQREGISPNRQAQQGVSQQPPPPQPQVRTPPQGNSNQRSGHGERGSPQDKCLIL